MVNTDKITINDVARLAGVSKRTVSRVINGSPLVGENTRKKIETVIKEVNFQPDKQARGLASKRSYLIGLVYDNPDALYIDQIQRAILDVCASQGFELVVHPCHWKEESFVDGCLQFIYRSKVDGVIIVPPVSESQMLADALQQIKYPYVRIASASLDDPENTVVSDERAAMRDIVEHLVSLKHTEIAMITGPLEYRSSQERLGGIQAAAREFCIDLPPSRITEGNNSYESGVICGEKLLTKPNRPTAIFANNDEMAAGVVRAARDLDIHIPKELSLVGFDDNLYASRIVPSLTTMRRPVDKLAKIATQKLIKAFNKEAVASNHDNSVRPYLIERESSAMSKQG